MKVISPNIKTVFFSLLKAGLWEKNIQLIPFEPIDFDALYQLADEQSIVGLLAAGLEHVEDRKVAKREALSFLKKVYSIETKNASMNQFIDALFQELKENGIFSVLVKGQGVAQCYERPQWRSSGDIDLFLDSNNYEKAKAFFSKKADSMHAEGAYTKHLGMEIDSWIVELHGTLRSGLSTTIDSVIDDLQNDTFGNNRVRVWRNGDADVYLPAPENDVLFIFTHYLEHFYKGGIGLRQICDWCRLLWTYRDSINNDLLRFRLKKMGLESEWKTFAAFSVEFLGMPSVAIPLYDPSPRWLRKAERIQSFILEVGNLGRNRDMSYYQKYPYYVRKAISFWRRCCDLIRHAPIFPLNSFRFFPSIVFNGVISAVKGE